MRVCPHQKTQANARHWPGSLQCNPRGAGLRRLRSKHAALATHEKRPGRSVLTAKDNLSLPTTGNRSNGTWKPCSGPQHALRPTNPWTELLMQAGKKGAHLPQHVLLIREEDIMMRTRECDHMRPGHAIFNCFLLPLCKSCQRCRISLGGGPH
jgi:hypothetical protein